MARQDHVDTPPSVPTLSLVGGFIRVFELRPPFLLQVFGAACARKLYARAQSDMIDCHTAFAMKTPV
jgi:hypothetical protein